MTRKILGTNKFIIYMYNGKNVRSKKPTNSRNFLGKQWGRVWEVDENGKMLGDGLAFTDYGEMLHFINQISSKNLRKNLKGK